MQEGSKMKIVYNLLFLILESHNLEYHLRNPPKHKIDFKPFGTSTPHRPPTSDLCLSQSTLSPNFFLCLCCPSPRAPLSLLFPLKDGDTALMWASQNGHLDIVAILVDHGADIHAVNEVCLKRIKEGEGGRKEGMWIDR